MIAYDEYWIDNTYDAKYEKIKIQAHWFGITVWAKVTYPYRR